MEEIYCKKSGKGIPVILIHGFCETHEIWSEFAQKLALRFEVLAIDLPGFGQSKLLPLPLSMPAISEKIIQWTNINKIIQPVVIGHSLGGYVALSIAKLYPEKISGLGLFHSTPYPDSDERKSNRNRVIEFVKENGVAPFMDVFVPGLFLNKKHSAIHFVDEIARKTTEGTLLAYTSLMRDRPSSIESLRTFEKPVLVLAGENDSIIPAESVRNYGQLAKKSTVHILTDCAHMAMFEKPAEAEKIVTDFILSL